VPIDLIAPGQVWGDRVNEVDLRFGKILKLGRARTNVGIDVYNILNSDAVTTYNNGYSPTGAWLTPTAILPARYVRFNLQLDF